MTPQQARQFALNLMETADAALLATVDGEGCPQTRAMLNLRNRKQYPKLARVFAGHEDDFLVYLTTNTSSAKVPQIRAHPAVALYYCTPAEFHGLMLGGKAEIVDDPQVRESLWQDGWEMYYPGGPNDPDHTVLRVLPSVARGWHGGGKFAFDLPAREPQRGH